MTLAIRILPVLLTNGTSLVKGERFDPWRVIGEPVQAARVFAGIRSVDELVLLDVRKGAPPNMVTIERISRECFIPLAYGGGIHDIETATALIAAGCDKLVLKDFSVIPQVMDRFGCNAAVACVDADDAETAASSAAQAVALGAGEVLLQDKNRDGTMTGFDLDLIATVRAAVPDVPLVVAGGASCAADFVWAAHMGVDGIGAGALWQFTSTTPVQVKQLLAEAHFPVRPAERPYGVN